MEDFISILDFLNDYQISKDLHRNKYIFLIGNYKNINNEKIINSIIKAKNNNL